MKSMCGIFISPLYNVSTNYLFSKAAKPINHAVYYYNESDWLARSVSQPGNILMKKIVAGEEEMSRNIIQW